MKRLTLPAAAAFFLSLILLVPGFSQENSGLLNYYMDVVTFPNLGNREISDVEIIFGFDLSQLSLDQMDDQFVGAFELQVSIFDTASQTVDGKLWNQQAAYPAENFKEQSRAVLFPYVFALEPGSYIFQSSLTDSVSGRTASIRKDIEVKAFSGETVRISGIEFASKMEAKNTQSPFNKYGIEVIPKPNRVYNNEENLLFYCEIVNLEMMEENDPGYTVQYLVRDLQDNLIMHQGPVMKKKVGSATTEASGLSIKELEEGNYVLQIVTTDLTNSQSDTAVGAFTVLKQRTAEQGVQLNEEMALNFYHMIFHLIPTQRRDIYNELELRGKSVFMRQFWNDRDPTPDTPENEYQKDIFSRWAHICLNFGGIDKAWNTDMGRIYMKYGEPSEYERHLHAEASKPYVIWRYHNGPLEFFFVDLRARGKFTLIHSVTPDYSEIRDLNWERRVFQ